MMCQGLAWQADRKSQPTIPWTDLHLKYSIKNLSDFPGDPVVKNLSFPLQGVQVQSLAEGLRSHMLHCVVKKKKKKRIYLMNT